jgi:hypothetical protein
MKPFVLPFPFLGVRLRVEVLPLPRRRADLRSAADRKAAADYLSRELNRFLLVDVGLDTSRQD